ncbi:MAG: hypothetical protein ACW985_11195, partial [Candidatus Thorarchaeota archaeon]
MNRQSSAAPSPFQGSTSTKTHGIVKIAVFLHFVRGWALAVGYILIYYLGPHTGGIDPVNITIPFPLFIGILDIGMSFYLLNLGRGSWEYCTLVSGITALFVFWTLPALFATIAVGVEIIIFIFLFLAISL